jgi:NhaP-type Na+/H+ or K+/H+ antiporter
MARAVLGFNEQFERLGEVAVVVVIGTMLTQVESYTSALVLAIFLFLVVRPTATVVSLGRTAMSGPQRAFIAWFGVRGIGSIYYLAFASTHGVPSTNGRLLTDVTLVVVAVSIVAHGVSVTPLMKRYAAKVDAHPTGDSSHRYGTATRHVQKTVINEVAKLV